MRDVKTIEMRHTSAIGIGRRAVLEGWLLIESFEGGQFQSSARLRVEKKRIDEFCGHLFCSFFVFGGGGRGLNSLA